MTTPSGLQRIKAYEAILQHWQGGSSDRIKRHGKFINTCSSYNQILYGCSATALVFATAVMGGLAGLEIGGKAGKIIAKEPGEMVGRKVGFAIGFTGGGGIGFYIYMNRSEKTDTYIGWILEIKDFVFNEEFKIQNDNDVILKDYKCTILHEIMIMPVRLQTGHLFDMLALDGITPDNKGRISCPLTRDLVAISSITIDLERGLLIHKRIQHLINVDIQNSQGNPDIQGLLIRKT